MARPEWRDAAKERRWRRLLQRWRRSGLTGRDFCAHNALSEPSFYAWKREIAQRDQEPTACPATVRLAAARRRSAEPRRRSAEALPAFLPVRVDAVGSAPPALPALEVVLAGGRLLRVRAGFDADVLRQLLAVLEEPSC